MKNPPKRWSLMKRVVGLIAPKRPKGPKSRKGCRAAMNSGSDRAGVRQVDNAGAVPNSIERS
jgi:hypothetical protein